MFNSLYWFHRTPDARTYYLFRLPSVDEIDPLDGVEIEYPRTYSCASIALYAEAANNYDRFVHSHRDADGNFSMEIANKDGVGLDRMAWDIHIWMEQAAKDLHLDWNAFYNDTLYHIAKEGDEMQWNIFCNLFAPEMNKALRMIGDKRRHFYK